MHQFIVLPKTPSEEKPSVQKVLIVSMTESGSSSLFKTRKVTQQKLWTVPQKKKKK